MYFCVSCFPAQVIIATLLGAERKWRLKEYVVSERYAYSEFIFVREGFLKFIFNCNVFRLTGISLKYSLSCSAVDSNSLLIQTES